MTTTEQIRAAVESMPCHCSRWCTCSYCGQAKTHFCKQDSTPPQDCRNCGFTLEWSEWKQCKRCAVLALPVEPAGPSAIQVNELRAKCAAEPGGFSGLSNSEIASVVTLLSENDFDTSIVLRVAIALQSAVEPSPDADCQQCGHLMRWHDPSNGIDDTHACVQCALIAANARIGLPSPDVLTAADALAEAAKLFVDEHIQDSDGVFKPDCPECMFGKLLDAYRVARNQAPSGVGMLAEGKGGNNG